MRTDSQRAAQAQRSPSISDNATRITDAEPHVLLALRVLDTLPAAVRYQAAAHLLLDAHPDLAAIVDAWPKLTDAVKAQILALIRGNG